MVCRSDGLSFRWPVVQIRNGMSFSQVISDTVQVNGFAPERVQTAGPLHISQQFLAGRSTEILANREKFNPEILPTQRPNQPTGGAEAYDKPNDECSTSNFDPIHLFRLRHDRKYFSGWCVGRDLDGVNRGDCCRCRHQSVQNLTRFMQSLRRFALSRSETPALRRFALSRSETPRTETFRSEMIPKR